MPTLRKAQEARKAICRFLPTSELLRLSDGKLHNIVVMQKQPGQRTVYIDGKQVSP